jgi:hypothetical protein
MKRRIKNQDKHNAGYYMMQGKTMGLDDMEPE